MAGGWKRIGETEWLLEHDGAAPSLGALRAVPGVLEVWRTAAGTAIATDPASFAEASLSAEFPSEPRGATGRLLTIPVDYSRGPDLADVAQALGVSTDQVVEHHTGSEYVCTSVGFAPGFAYLGPLVGELAAIGRKPSPRPRVDAGMVAIAAGSTAVYPGGTPGGWWLIGQTPLVVCDWREGYFGIGVGDTVRFQSIGEDEFNLMVGERLCVE
ncbi:MAG: carboxyltransferase domain-containing protein [Fimbriimonadaceae bacterium]|nr:carboxyltransferase domain-containing protein [Fimbriimonadaceae bacterium]